MFAYNHYTNTINQMDGIQRKRYDNKQHSGGPHATALGQFAIFTGEWQIIQREPNSHKIFVNF